MSREVSSAAEQQQVPTSFGNQSSNHPFPRLSFARSFGCFHLLIPMHKSEHMWITMVQLQLFLCLHLFEMLRETHPATLLLITCLVYSSLLERV